MGPHKGRGPGGWEGLGPIGEREGFIRMQKNDKLIFVCGMSSIKIGNSFFDEDFWGLGA